MTKALLIIDYTNDFVADDGALTVGKPAQQLDGYLTELADRFYQNGDVVLFRPTPTTATTPSTRNPSSFHPTTSSGHRAATSMARSATGTRPTRIATGSISSPRTATRPLPTPTLTTTSASGGLPTSGSVGSAPISVSSTRRSAPTTWTTSSPSPARGCHLHRARQ